MLGFLRLLTTRQIMGERTMVVADALKIYDRLFDDSRVQFRQEPIRIGRAIRSALEPVKEQAAPKAISDCYLIAFAKTSNAYLVTMDKALAGIGQQRGIGVEFLAIE